MKIYSLSKITGILIFGSLIFCSFNRVTDDNRLTKKQKKEGWKLLFDGKDMNGWRTYQNKPSNSWSVNNRILYCKPVTSAEDKRSDLITNGQFENFELSLDWKISDKGNSGILYMVTEQYKNSYLSGPEYQIIDDINYPEKLESWQRTASNYAMHAAPHAAIRPAGIWNHTKIIVNMGHVEHWLNNKKVVSYELYSVDWYKNKQLGKWKDVAEYGMSKKGHIALQDHGSEAWFKNIKIKEL